MGLGSVRARRARDDGAPLPDVLLLEAIDLGWMTVLHGSVVQVLHAAAKLQSNGSTGPIDAADEEAEFDLDDALPTPTLTWEIPSAAPRGPDRCGEAVLGRRARTYRDVVDLCLALGLLARSEEGLWWVRTPLPPPIEALPLEGEDRAFHDHRHWQAQLRPTARAMMRTFLEAARGSHPPLPFDHATDRLSCTASLYWWCQRTDAHPEAVRRAAQELAVDHGFSATPAPERLYWDEPFTLTVDWEGFERVRTEVESASAPVGPAADRAGPGGR